MLNTLVKKIGRDRDYPDRVAGLEVLQRVLEGTLYDVLEHDFHEEKSEAGEYIPVAKRRPSVRYNLSRIVVADSVALLFGEGRFPTLDCEDERAKEALADLIEEARLADVMAEAAFRGSVGSIVVWMRILESRVFFEPMDTQYLTPEWKAAAPDTLDRVTERYKLKGRELVERGYPVSDPDLEAWWWFSREWNAAAEVWYLPWKVNRDPGKAPKPPTVDKKRTVQHGLGFVPMVWIRNLPSRDRIDGACTFRPAIETQIEIEYQLSQAGRGLKYSSDPLLLLKEPAAGDGPIIRSSSNALIVDKDGDGKMLEINGTASAAVIEYARACREMALETIHGNRSSADRLTAAQSGRALELLHQPLIWLADKLRTSYGKAGVLPLLRMVVAARQKVEIVVMGEPMPEIPSKQRLSLVWPPWFQRTEADRQSQAGSLSTLVGAGILSRQTAITVVSPEYDQADPKAEEAQVAKEEAEADARLVAREAQVKANENIPA